MKKNIFLLMALIIGGINVAYAQGAMEARMKQVRKEYKLDKLAKNNAKESEKKGWTVFEGSLPMAQQMEEYYVREKLMDDDGDPLYYFGHGSFRTDDKNAAYKNACIAARQDIASQLETELVEAFTTDVRSEKVSPEESVAVSKAIAEGKGVVSAKLAGVRPIVSLYRRDKYQYEVEVNMYYNREKAMQIAREAVRENLAHEETGLKNLVDDILDAQLKKK